MSNDYVNEARAMFKDRLQFIQEVINEKDWDRLEALLGAAAITLVYFMRNWKNKPFTQEEAKELASEFCTVYEEYKEKYLDIRYPFTQSTVALKDIPKTDKCE